MSISDARCRYWQIAVRHLRYLDALDGTSVHPSCRVTALRHARIGEERRRLRNQARDQCEAAIARLAEGEAKKSEEEAMPSALSGRLSADNREEFEQWARRRRRYHREEEEEAVTKLLRHVRQLSLGGEPQVAVTLSDATHTESRWLLQVAAQDLTDWTKTSEEEVGQQDIEIKTWALSEGEVEELVRLAHSVAEHRAWLNVIEEAKHHLDGHDTYRASRLVEKKPFDTTNEVAEALVEKDPDARVKDLTDQAMEDWVPSEKYRGSREEKKLRKAIYQAIRRAKLRDDEKESS